MGKLIARLILTGMPRKVALCVCRSIRSRAALEKYVEEVEDECRVRLDAV